VAQTRRRNLFVSGGLLVLILATAGLLVHYARRTQQLAELQMNFVAGVSHELRTPLTVIQTAAFNLPGRLAQQPAQAQQYGRLIQDESLKLTSLVEQVLRFGSAKNGLVAGKREPVRIESLIEQSLEATLPALNYLTVDKQIESGLPPVLVD